MKGETTGVGGVASDALPEFTSLTGCVVCAPSPDMSKKHAPADAKLSSSDLLRGVFDGRIECSEYQLIFLSADDSGSCSLSFQRVSGTTFNVGTEEEGASSDEQ